MHNLFTLTLARISDLMTISRETYNVNPQVFLLFYFGSGPLYYYALYRIVRAVLQRLHYELSLWSTVFLISTAAPFFYLLAFGRNLPWWLYALVIAVVLQAVGTLIWKFQTLAAAPLATPRVRSAFNRIRHPQLTAVRRHLKHSGDGLARRCFGLSHTIARIARRRLLRPAPQHARYRNLAVFASPLALARRLRRRPDVHHTLRRVRRRPHARLYHRYRVPRMLRLNSPA